MGWKIEQIRERHRKEAEQRFASADKSALLDHIAALEAALYPFAYVLGSLDQKSWRGTHATSKLFPSQFECIPSGELPVWNSETKHYEGAAISEDKLHAVEYSETESLTIEDGTKLDNEFDILAVHQQSPGAYVSCGSITMGDARRAHALVFFTSTDLKSIQEPS